MLKRLFIIIFTLQTFATSAWAGIDVSQLNQAEMSKMQMMHTILVPYKMDTAASQSGKHESANMHSMADCDMLNCNLCNEGMGCQNLMCSAAHSTTPFYAQANITHAAIFITNSIVAPLSVPIKHSNSQPETPPPSA